MDMRQIDTGAEYIVINQEREPVAVILRDAIVTKDGYEVIIRGKEGTTNDNQ